MLIASSTAAGTDSAQARSASALRSRESPSRPTSFSTCTMITVSSAATSRRCAIRARNAAASAAAVSGPKGERCSTGPSPVISARGNRSTLVLTHAGAYVDWPFFHAPNHSGMSRSPSRRHAASISSISVVSNRPSSGSKRSQATAARTVLAPISRTRAKEDRIASGVLELELWISAPRTTNLRPSTNRSDPSRCGRLVRVSVIVRSQSFVGGGITG